MPPGSQGGIRSLGLGAGVRNGHFGCWQVAAGPQPTPKKRARLEHLPQPPSVPTDQWCLLDPLCLYQLGRRIKLQSQGPGPLAGCWHRVQDMAAN